MFRNLRVDVNHMARKVYNGEKEIELLKLDKNDIARLQREFADSNVVLLENFLNEGNLKAFDEVYEKCKVGEFEVWSGFIKEIAEPTSLNVKWHIFLNQPKVLDLLSQIVGHKVSQFEGGRFVIMEKKHFLKWHIDKSNPNRIIGISINLSFKEFEGGKLQLRKVGEEIPFSEKTFNSRGDALIFTSMIDPTIEHRVSPLMEGSERIIFTGWYVQ